MNKIDNILYQALIKQQRIEVEALDSLAKQAEVISQTLASRLIKENVLREEDVLMILSEELNLPYADLQSVNIEKAVIDRVPLKVSHYYKFLPIKIEGNVLTIAVSYPLDIKIQDEIRMQLGIDIELNLAKEKDITDMLNKYYGLGADTLEKIISQVSGDEMEAVVVQDKIEDIEKLVEDASLIKLVNQIILEAYKKRATDIHIEPYRNEVILRYRIDGVLYDAKVPLQIKQFFGAIISRIKIMSNLNIVEHRLPQDGRAIVKTLDQTLDLRISTLPTSYGESVVIRILPTKMLLSLESLGLMPKELELFEKLVKKPYGVVFVTGPTGSGKTTTLYACLSRINTKERKIITIEDPIEYEMKGVTQIQVMSHIGLDFARGLRSMLRHDPDVMMVGEVRDLETAEIAIRVALTGHLVFSTLHTNDAASGVTRLLDIGVEPYLVASSIEAFIAQRLIRVICPKCKEEDEDNSLFSLKEQINRGLKSESPEKIKFYRGRGCEYCNFTGFFGRTAIYEILLADERIKDAILKRDSASQIKKIAVLNGMRILRQDGWRKIVEGITTPQEVMRVTPSEVNETTKEGGLVELIQAGIDIGKDDEYSDRRVYTRLALEIDIKYKIFNSAEELLNRAYTPEHLTVTVTKNISASGLLFVSKNAIQTGAILELVVDLPDRQKPIECLARVLRVKEDAINDRYDVAVCFLDIPSVERARLDKYIANQKRSNN